MKNIFIGFLLIFLDFNIDLDHTRIGLIPDFIGYIVLAKGLLHMADESPRFMKVKPFATFMAFYTGILYVLDLFGVTVNAGVFTYLLGIVSMVISLYISYHIVMGVLDTEEKHGVFLNGASLKSTWKLLTFFTILSNLLLLIPTLAILSIIASFVIAIVFLVAFNRSKNLYYNKISW